MKKGILFLIFLIVPLLGTATHIVGGEFELIHISGYQYRLNLVIYFDEINGSPPAKDINGQDIRIFRKFDNVVMANIHLPYVSESLVSYTQPSCSHGELRTSRILYSNLVTLSPNSFNHAAGYYIGWERCCRNYGITNIFSQDPNAGGVLYAGQTFYLEFPPVIKNGVQFIDSTPRLFPPLNDYACPTKPYYTDFGGTDDDDDSLVYSLVTPLNTKTSESVPVNGSRPAPYPVVNYRVPFSPANIMNGAPDLRITTDGFLTVTPTTQGLYVFAVKVEEFRDKVKIGETRRDFQMLVVDACPVAVPPSIVGKKIDDPTYSSSKNLFVQYNNTTTDAQRCITVKVSDADSQRASDSFNEKVKIKVIPLNFKKDLSGLLPSVINATLSHGSTAEFNICFPDCPLLFPADAIIGIIAMDDACSLPLTDTLKVTIRVEPPPNTKPRFVQPATNPVTGVLAEGTQDVWPYQIIDDDNDPLVITLLTNNFILADAGMTFNTLNQTNGAAEGELKWNAYCDIFDFTKRTSFMVTIQVEDQDRCKIINPAKEVFNLSVILPGNASPTIDTDLTPASRERRVTGITRRINEPLNFSVTGKDIADNDLLVLTGRPKDFVLSDYGITITPPLVTGNGLVNNLFQWNISCTSVDLKKKDTFDFQFIVVDNANKCRFYKADTVDVQMKVLPPLNQAPVLSVTNSNSAATELSNNGISTTLGNAIKLLLTGTDNDLVPAKDKLKIALVSKDGEVAAEGFTFSEITGTSPIQTTFTWQPDCSIFKNGVYENDYTFKFMLTDDHCITAKKDSVTITVKIKDLDGSDSNFMPPNFFSPNGDNVNDYFAMELKDNTTGEVKNILPLDNCASQFESVRIYNRWGNQVYQSLERNFQWDGKGESAGVYFYFLKYTEKEYRGTVSLRY